MTFAQRLAELLKNGNMTAYRLSKTLGVHQTTVKNWLDGNSKPRTEYMEKIAEHFGVSIDYLMGNSEAPLAEVITAFTNIKKEAMEDDDTLERLIKKLDKLIDYDSMTTWNYLSTICRNERIEQDLTERYVAQLSNIPLPDYLDFEMGKAVLSPQKAISILKALGIKPGPALSYLEGYMVANMKEGHEKEAFLDEDCSEAEKLINKIMLEITELDLDTLEMIMKEIKAHNSKSGNNDSAKFEKALVELKSIKKSPQNEPGA